MMLRLDHVQLAIPEGAEDLCRHFYVDLLGLAEVPKPPGLAGRGGLWLESGPVKIHLGVEDDFRPARKAHPALAVSDLDSLAQRLSAPGCQPIWDDAIAEIRRFYVADPVGNRIEVMEG
jgi:catechol 2,3-dioxygenase-like lactoylglutathione lyase family enzyme